MEKLVLNGVAVLRALGEALQRPKHDERQIGIFPGPIAIKVARYLRKFGFKLRLFPRGKGSGFRTRIRIGQAEKLAVYVYQGKCQGESDVAQFLLSSTLSEIFGVAEELR